MVEANKRLREHKEIQDEDVSEVGVVSLKLPQVYQ